MLRLIRSFRTSAVDLSKVSKRKKFDRLKDAPHIQAVKRSEKKDNQDYCLEHFDSFHKKTYGEEWHSMRLALLSKPKHCALINNFGQVNAATKKLRESGCYSIKDAVNVEYNRITMSKVTEEEDETILNPDSRHKRPSQDPADPEEAEEVIKSMDPGEAKSRIISSEELLISGGGPGLPAASVTMYDHVPPDTLIGMDDFIEESEYYSRYQKVIDDDLIPVKVVKEEVKQFPSNMDAWTFPSGMTEELLMAPERGVLGTLDYYCMDAASLLPVIFMDIKPHETVFDMCSGPGGKSLAIAQTLRPSLIHCNDADGSRLQRVKNTFSSYLNTGERDFSQGLVEYTRLYGEGVEKVIENRFNKVLCDVMCTTDRHSLRVSEGNWFAPQLKQKRLQLPASQSLLLQSALQLVKPGGSVVYSTCTLSPAQNDGVVYDALRKIWMETELNFVVNDLSDAIEPYRKVMKLSNSTTHKMRYGQMVIPHMPNNFGPMYFAKITRE